MADFRIVVTIDPTGARRGGRRVERSLQGVGTQADRTRQLITRAFAFVGVGVALRQLTRLTDLFTELRNRTRIAVGELGDVNSTLNRLRGIANRTRTPVSQMVELFQRGSIAAAELGASQEELLRFTTAVGQGLAIQGGAAGTASGAILQLSQSLGSGIVRAEEFNSILEGAFPIAQAAARGIDEAGGSVARLRQLIVSGDITSRQFFEGILNQADELDRVFSTTVPTISQSLTVLQNNLISFIGEQDQAAGVSGLLSRVIIGLSENLGILARGVGALALVFGARLVRSAFLASASFIGVNRNSLLLIQRFAQIRGVSLGAATGLFAVNRAARVARVGLSFLGGPLGVGLLAAFAIYEFASANDRARESLFELPESIDDFRQSLERLTHAQQAARAFEIQDVLRDVESEIERVERRLTNLRSPTTVLVGLGGLGGLGGVQIERQQTEALDRERTELQSEIDTLRQRASAEQQRLSAIQEAQSFVGPRPPAGTRTFSPPSSVDTEAVERANKQIEGIHRVTQDRIAGLTLDRIGLIDREERLLVERLRQAGETQGTDASAVQRAISEVVRAASLERASVLDEEAAAVDSIIEQLRFESDQLGRSNEQQRLYNELKRAGVSADSEAGREIANVVSMLIEQRDATEALAEAERNHERALQSIRSQFESLLPAYGQAVVQANRWRTEALAGLDPLRAGYESFRAQVESIYDGLIEQAMEARDTEADRATQELALEHARSLEQVRQAQIAVGLATRDSARDAELWANTVREGIDATAAGARQALEAIDAIIERQRQLATDDPLAGLRVGLDQISTQIPSVAEQIADTTTNAFQSMEAALADFVRTGKLDFGSLVDSILADLARIAIRQAIIGPLSAALSGALAGAFGGSSSPEIIRLQHGGLVRGPGGPRSDSILARLSSGEYVVNAAASRRHRSLLESINRSPRFQGGGPVPATALPDSGSAGRGVVVQVIDQRTTAPDDDSLSVSEQRGPDGSRILRILIRDSVNSDIRSGQFDSSLGSRYGSRPSIARR